MADQCTESDESHIMSEQNTSVSQSWEKEVIEKMLFEVLKEQRRNRRWRIFFRLLGLGIIVAILVAIFAVPSATAIKPHTALIEIKGVIQESGKASAANVIEGLGDAFDDQNTKGVILDINSPGGSPVQSGLVFDEIVRLKKLHPKIKVYAVCSDICASGAYYIAAAADEIYADKASMVGSIGVLMNGFGFVGTIDKLGVERRLLTAGKNKAFLDPFSPLNDNQVKYADEMLSEIHQQFIQSVQNGRGDRLKNDPDLFSGLVWTGEKAQPLGLIDGLGSTQSVARDIIKEENIIDYTYHGGILQKFADNISSQASQQMYNRLVNSLTLG